MRHFSPNLLLHSLFLLINCPFLPVYGVFKLQDTDTELVNNPMENVVYLFQGPRISASPSLAAFTMKVETWLHWNQIPFHRINNEVFLGSASAGTVPFAYLNGKYIDGSDKIIEEVGKHFGKYKYDEEDVKLRKMIGEELFKMVIYDRTLNMEWLIRDEGFVEQMLPMAIPNHLMDMPDQEHIMIMTCASLRAYFIASNDSSKRANFMKKFLRKKSEMEDGKIMLNKNLIECDEIWEEEEEVQEEVGEEEKGEKAEAKAEVHTEEEQVDGEAEVEAYKEKEQEAEAEPHKEEEQEAEASWEEFNKWFSTSVIEATMATVLLDKMPNGERNTKNPNNSQAKSKEFLRLNELRGKDGQTRPFSDYSVEQIYEELKTRLNSLETKLKQNHGHSLRPGEKPHSTADASLFGVLLQFFETPLNDPQIKSLFPEGGILHKFVQNIKRTLGLDEEHWKKLTQRPWIQNYDTDYIFAVRTQDKYIGPYKLTVGDLNIKNFYTCVTYDGSQVQFVPSKKETEKLPEEIVWAAKRLAKIASQSSRGLHPHDYYQAMLSVMAAYVCDAENWGARIVPNKKWKGIKALGRQKEKECTRRHIKRSLDMFKSLKIKGDARIQVETEVRAVVFNTIVDYNDAKTRTNVVEAIREVQKVAAQSQEDAARVTSSPSLTNEL